MSKDTGYLRAKPICVGGQGQPIPPQWWTGAKIMQPNEFARDFSFLPPIARRYAEDHFKATQSDTLNMRDCCSFLGISDTTLYRYVKKGIISSSKLNAYYRFDLAALSLVKSGEKHSYSKKIEEEKPQRGRPRKLKTSPDSLLKTLNAA